MTHHLHSLRLYLLGLLLALANATSARAADPPAPLADLSFPTAGGKQVAWNDVAGKNATVVVSLSFDCPTSTG